MCVSARAVDWAHAVARYSGAHTWQSCLVVWDASVGETQQRQTSTTMLSSPPLSGVLFYLNKNEEGVHKRGVRDSLRSQSPLARPRGQASGQTRRVVGRARARVPCANARRAPSCGACEAQRPPRPHTAVVGGGCATRGRIRDARTVKHLQKIAFDGAARAGWRTSQTSPQQDPSKKTWRTTKARDTQGFLRQKCGNRHTPEHHQPH